MAPKKKAGRLSGASPSEPPAKKSRVAELDTPTINAEYYLQVAEALRLIQEQWPGLSPLKNLCLSNHVILRFEI